MNNKVKTGLVTGLAAIVLGCGGKKEVKDFGTPPSVKISVEQTVGTNGYKALVSARDPDGDIKSFSFNLDGVDNNFNYNLYFEPDSSPVKMSIRENRNIEVNESVIEFSGEGIFGKLNPGGYIISVIAIDKSGNSTVEGYKFIIPQKLP